MRAFVLLYVLSASTLSAATDPIAMGANAWIDGNRFDPARAVEHLADLAIARPEVDLAALAALNPPGRR